MRAWLKKYLLLLCCIASAVYIHAQIPGSRHFRIDEEPDIKILTIYKSHQGYIYAGTSKGLYRFDGIQFTHIPFQNEVANKTITAIFEDSKYHVWVGMETGDIARIIKNQLKLFVPEESTPKKTITAFLQDKGGRIWFATDGEGVYYIYNDHLYNINSENGLSENSVYSLTPTEDGEVLAGTDQGISICKIFGSSKKVININSKKGLPDNFVKSITAAGNNTFWIGMQDKGLCLYDNNSREFVLSPNYANWKYGQINKLLKTQNNVWVATENFGIIKTKDNFKTVEKIRIDDGQYLNINKKIRIDDGQYLNINDIMQDNEGNIWFLVNNDELIKTPGDQLQVVVNYKENEYQNVHAILCDNKNNIWQGTSRGLIKYAADYGPSQSFTINGVGNKKDVTALYQDIFGRIWIGTMGNGIYLLDEKTGQIRNLTEDKLLQRSSVLSITGKGNTVFVSSLEGAAAFTLGNETSIHATFNYYNYTNVSSIGSNYVYDIYKDSKGRIWFGTDGKGITLLENDKFTNYGQEHGLKDLVVYSITEDLAGNIWFSTHSAGVYKFDGKTFTNYSTENGLSDINISAVKSDKSGKIIIVYKKGIDLLNPETGRISYINKNQGVKEINVQDLGTVSQDTSGGVLVSSVDGILSYHSQPGKVRQPQIILEKVALFLDPVDTGATHNFSYNNNSFTFSFIGIYYSDPEAVHYQYKLDGFNNEWTPTKDRSVTFPKLPPAKYTFRIRSSINQAFNGANEASYDFVIEKPYWTAWWFVAGCAIVAGGLFYWYVKAREKSVKKVERLQQEKIKFQFETLRNQVNPHFLFNSFNTLISIIEDDPKSAVGYVEQLSDFFRNIVNYRDKDIISLKEEINLLQTYFFIQQKRFGSALVLDIRVNEQQQKETFIPPLTLQLLGENAIKHNAVSKESSLIIEIYIQGDKLIVKNNINLKITKSSGAGMGLQNIISRYTLLSKQEVDIPKDKNSFIVSLPILKQRS